MGKSTGFRFVFPLMSFLRELQSYLTHDHIRRYAGKGPGLQKKSKLARKYLPKSSNKVKGGQMDSLDWGVEVANVPKHLISTGLNSVREVEAEGNSPIDGRIDSCRDQNHSQDQISGVVPDSSNSSIREPRSLAEKFGLVAIQKRVGDALIDKAAREKAMEKTALKKLKKCSPV